MRKSVLWFSCCVLGSLSLAQAQQPNPQQMQQMMQQVQQMQKCMGTIDPAKMQAFASQGQKMGAEVKALCQAGKRDEAMKVAMRYGQQMASDPAMQKIRSCSADLVSQLGPLAQYDGDERHHEKQHICDIQN